MYHTPPISHHIHLISTSMGYQIGYQPFMCWLIHIFFVVHYACAFCLLYQGNLHHCAYALPLPVSTSTLAMGVNLPAHLVVIKSTQHYTRSGFEEYTETEILQMIGRAGRPQFDTSATAVIMTKKQTEAKYKSLVSGTQFIESRLLPQRYAIICV